jgi:pimeloyl-ACP methyl ester carboxylesterase
MLALERSGTGVPLVFLHAFPLSRKMWDVNRAAFSRNFQFITIDFPGFGESISFPADTTSMTEMADQVFETLNKAGITEKIVLAGVSMGGYAAFRFWERHPERVRSLALISTRSMPDTDAARQKRFENIDLIEKQGLSPFAEKSVTSLLGKTTLETQPALRDHVVDEIKKANPKAVCAALKGMASRPDSTPLLKSISVPTFVLSGEEDSIITTGEMREMAAQIPKSDFESIPRLGHLLTLENPTTFYDLFSKHLKRRVL